MEVTEVLDLWPEVHERRRLWLSPQVAAAHVHEPELAALILAFAGDLSEQALPTPAFPQVIWRKLKALLRPLGLR